MQASIYVRISLDRHHEELGIERQIEECVAFCESRGWEVGEIFADNDLSATSGVVRPEFERLLISNPEVVVCWHADRFIRLTSELERVIALGFNIHAVHAGQLDLSTHSGRMVARIITAVSQHEGEHKAARQRAAHKQRVQQGRPFWPVRPFGYTRNGEVVPAEADELRGMYRKVLAGEKMIDIIEDLNRRQVRTSRGGEWYHGNLRTLLLHPRNAGLASYHGEEAGPGNWEGIVPEDIYRAVKSMIAGRGKVTHRSGRTPSALLTVLAKCSECGHPVRVQRNAAWRKGVHRDIYVCRFRGCTTAPLEQADSIVIERMVDAAKDGEVLAYWLDTETRGTSLDEDERMRLKAQRQVLSDRLVELGPAFAKGLMTMEQVGAASEELQQEIANIDAAMGEAQERFLVQDLIADPEYMWDAFLRLPLATQRKIVGMMFESITFVRRGPRYRKPFSGEHVLTVPRK